MKVKSKLSFKINSRFTLLALLFLISFATSAQNRDINKMTPEERTAYRSGLKEAAEKDWVHVLSQLNIQMPYLPTAAEDTTRPKHLFQKPGSANWSDSTGNTYVRSGWGNWSNYDESLEKRSWGENIDNVAGSGLYHWMAGNLICCNGSESQTC